MIKDSRLRFFCWFLSGLLAIIVFKSFFSLQVVTATDFPFVSKEKLVEFITPPQAWSATRLGEVNVPYLFTWLPLFLFGLLGNVLNFALAERLVWFLPFLALSFFSSRFLFRQIFGYKNYFLFYILYSMFGFNTYILMVVGGGQMGLAIAYAMIPFVLGAFMKLVGYSNTFDRNPKSQIPNPKLPALVGLVLSVQVMFDPRVTYITLMAVGLYLIWRYFFIERFSLPLITYYLLLTTLIVVGLHFYWLWPSLLSGGISLPEGYNQEKWVEFLSFADFSNSLSLLHPNWPENIFGKIYFMRWEFLLMPILAYSSMLFTQISNCQLPIANEFSKSNSPKTKRKSINVLFFVLLGLVGAFLAKGANPPFGEVYRWLFKYFPGMSMFRDPTKFYTLVALSYSLLIPYSIWGIYGWLKSHSQFLISNSQFPIKFKIFNSQNLFLLFIVFYLLFLISPAWSRELSGTFKAKAVPQEYVALKDFLSSQPEFFRTFWFPKKQRFGFYTNHHPALSAQEVFETSELPLLVEKLKDSQTKELLSLMGVRYVILPDDSEKEIFLKDRKYDAEQRKDLEKELDTISWLRKVNCSSMQNHYNNIYYCSKIIVYEISNLKDHFWLEGGNIPGDVTTLQNAATEEEVEWRMVNPTRYLVSVKNLPGPVILVFSESFDARWMAKIGKEKIPSQKAYEGLNGFKISKTGDLEIAVEFEPQRYVNFGLIVSLFTLTITALLLLKSEFTFQMVRFLINNS